ncbi:membrane protein [Luteococcus japonicus]|uniref:Membrane protein n=1 Tax=Luteococcus japonicus TaxID=33984 RepID=A0A3N1ZQC8_9ACTN|nr:YihY/virulence factor BrkB family protein [Luteococcus japonicus]ROR53110.1 membrane protein [Luteococcus japonicus]
MSNETTPDETRRKAETAPHPEDPRKPSSPAQVKKPGWKFTAKNAWREFSDDQCTDLAAALTYYTVMALFPGMMALVSLLALFGQSEGGIDQLMALVKELAPGDAVSQIEGPLTQMVNSRGTGLALVIGLASALWSASGYVGAFGRAMNKVYETREGRPMVKLRATNLAITLFITLVAALMLVALVVSGPVAEAIGNVVGLGSQTVTVWNIAKWPVMLALLILMVAVLYHFTPNVRQPKFKWLSVGAGVAILVWILGSVLFALYVTHAGNYSKTYGALAGVIIMLLWLWLTNLALLFGAEVDSELERARELQAGMHAEKELQLPPRDVTGIEKIQEKDAKAVEEAREVRLQATGGQLPPEDQDAARAMRTKKGYDEDGFVSED